MKTRNRGVKLAIAGAGMTGAYLFRILKNQGYEADIFDREARTACGLKPCAWGTSIGFVDLVNGAGLDGESYILHRHDHVVMQDVRLRAELMIFDKPRLIKDLLKDAEIHRTPLPLQEYDRVIDASGASRAMLPLIEDDIVMECRQYLIETGESLENRIKLGGIGYAWCFPLSRNLYHVGCGSLLADPQRILKDLGWLQNTSSRYEKKIRCSCTGRIRLTGPYQSQPFVTNGSGKEIWGIGEAIGCVAPLAGDGVVPGMQSVQLLLNSWDEPRKYTEAVLGEFRWMRNERAVIDRLRRAERVGVREAAVLKKNAKRMKLQVGLREAVALLQNLR